MSNSFFKIKPIFGNAFVKIKAKRKGHDRIILFFPVKSEENLAAGGQYVIIQNIIEISTDLDNFLGDVNRFPSNLIAIGINDNEVLIKKTTYDDGNHFNESALEDMNDAVILDETEFNAYFTRES